MMRGTYQAICNNRERERAGVSALDERPKIINENEGLKKEKERLKALLRDHESTIVSQQEELWRLRDIVGGRW